MIVSRSVFLRIRNVSDRRCRGNQNTCFFFNFAFYEIILKNNLEPDRPQMTIWRLLIACRIPKSTNTRSEYVILTAFQIATTVTRMCLNYMLHVHYLSCLAQFTHLCKSVILVVVQ